MGKVDRLSLIFYDSRYEDLKESAGGEIRTYYIIKAYESNGKFEIIHLTPEKNFSNKFLIRHRILSKVLMLFPFFLGTYLHTKSNKDNKIIYCGTCYLWDIVPAIISKFMLNIKVACVSHDSPLQLNYMHFLKNQEKIKFPKIIISFISLRLQSFLLKFIDIPISISSTNVTFLKKLGLAKRMVLSSNGIPMQSFKLRQVYERYYDVVYIGRIIERKNIPILLEVWSLLKKIMPEVKLLLVTNTDEIKFSFVHKFLISSGLESNITIKQKVSEIEKFDLLNNSKISINLSSDETFSISTMESAYAGNALILSDKLFFKEIYADAAKYVDQYDKDGIALTIYKLLLDQNDLRTTMSKARSLAEHYTYDKVAEREIKQILMRIRNRT